MQSSTSSISARVLAPLALVACAVAVLAVVVGSTAGGDGESATQAAGTASENASTTTPTKQRRRQRRAYTVQPGDTLGGIAERTDVPVERMLELNPELDPQALIAGQRIKLRE